MGKLAAVLGLLLAVFVVACGGGAESEINTPLADVQASANEADRAALEAKVADYKSAIASREKELKAVVKESAAAATGALGDLLGDGGGDQGAADDLAEQLQQLKSDLKALGERMTIYAKALEQQTKDT